jgi:hypothetical protein
VQSKGLWRGLNGLLHQRPWQKNATIFECCAYLHK